MNNTETFGNMLKRLRTEARLTLRGLGHEADIPHSVIAAIESGNRKANLNTATRLAKALHVTDLSGFLLKAITTTKNQRVLPISRQHPAGTLNYLPMCLAAAGIMGRDVAECRYGELPYDGGRRAEEFEKYLHKTAARGNSQPSLRIDAQPLKCPKLLLKLRDGREVAISIIASLG